MVGAEGGFDFGKILSRNRYMTAAATPTPTTIASVDTDDIIRRREEERTKARERGGYVRA